MDSSLAPEALQLSLIPDILILPSDIKYFVKVIWLSHLDTCCLPKIINPGIHTLTITQVISSGEIEGENQSKCISVNPGRLAKGEGGGTFAELNYYGSPDMINASIVSIWLSVRWK